MKVGVSVEFRCPNGSVSFQVHVDCADESMRPVRKELVPGEKWVWKLRQIPPEQIAVFAIHPQHPVTVEINGEETLLDGQNGNDFGIAYARTERGIFGYLPFEGNLSEITVRDESGKKNRIDIILGEVPEPVVVTTPETDPMEESDSEESAESET